MKDFLALASLLAGIAYATPPNYPSEYKIRTYVLTSPSIYTPPQPSATLPPAYSYSHSNVTQNTTVSTIASVTSAATYGQPSHAPTYGSGSPSSSTAVPNNACASIRELALSSIGPANPAASPTATATVPAKLAYDCINSVPFNASAAVALMDSIRPYINWQTTVQYIKNPPAEYAEKVQEPYDFWAEFERIYTTAESGAYDSEYAFGHELYIAFQGTHDGHFVIYPDSVQQIFSFGRTTPIVSVSIDGMSIPEVFLYSDIMAATVGNATFTPSPITLIDGRNSTEYLLEWSQYGSLQDRDALWNNMFYLLQTVSLGSAGTGTGTFSGGGRGRWIYPGPSTTLTFANGSSVTNENFARVLVPFDNITSGADIYSEFFVPSEINSALALALATPTSTSSTTATSTTTSTSTSAAVTPIPAPGFPSPIARTGNNLNSGYFLEGEGYDDVAVLSLASFGQSLPDPGDFQAVNTYLIDQAVAHNKTKLILDVSANGGGIILQGYDLFKLLFPSILPYGATRFRAHEAIDYIGQESSYFGGLVPRSLDLNDTAIEIASSFANYRTDVDVNYENFDSWADKYGPEQLASTPGDDQFTNIIRWNMSDVLTPVNSGGIFISGYNNRTNITQQPFAAENIVIVTDGYCASTCTIFSELMRQQAGVKSIALGGRPNTDIIQSVGGVKGTNSFPMDYILSTVLIPFTYEYIHSREFYESTELGAYNDLVLSRTTNAVTNARDGFREGDEENTPLQFVYEPADCRIFYTPAMAVDQVAAWKTYADAAFNGVERCVAGSLISPGGNGSEKRGLQKMETHAVRRSLDLSMHYHAMSNVWTGRGGITVDGDSVMIP